MKHLFGCLMLIGTLWIGTFDLQAGQLPLFLERADGLDSEKKHDYLGALIHFKVLMILLERIRDEDPQWEHELVLKDLADSKEKITTLQPLAVKQVLDKNHAILSSGPPISMLYVAGGEEPDHLKAMHLFEEYQSTLEIIHESDPQWEAVEIEKGIKQAKEQLSQLAPEVLKDALPVPGPDHTVQ